MTITGVCFGCGQSFIGLEGWADHEASCAVVAATEDVRAVTPGAWVHGHRVRRLRKAAP